jgi:hypothetical protein
MQKFNIDGIFDMVQEPDIDGILNNLYLHVVFYKCDYTSTRFFFHF